MLMYQNALSESESEAITHSLRIIDFLLQLQAMLVVTAEIALCH